MRSLMARARPRLRHLDHRLMAVVASVVALILPFVTPVDGARVSLDHALQLVHPIFVHAHTHDEDAETVEAPSAGYSVAPMIVVTAPGQTGAGVGVASEGMLSASVLRMLIVQPSLARRAERTRLGDQYLLLVPTGPPRRGTAA